MVSLESCDLIIIKYDLYQQITRNRSIIKLHYFIYLTNNDILDDFLDIFKFQMNENQSKISLFNVLTPRNMNKFYSSVVKMKFCRGQFVYKEDEMPNSIYYIIQGQIEVCIINYIIL